MIGIDEVGRGCWAGPLLVVAARAKTDLPKGLKDSKKLTALQRQKLAPLIVASCDLGEGWVTAQEIDAMGLSNAMRMGVSRALDALHPLENEEVVIDGGINYVAQIPQGRRLRSQAVPKADDEYPLVSAASIYAKVVRDSYMSEAAVNFPDYGFEKHVGYGTAIHLAALNLQGICELHRLSFAPVKVFVREPES